MILAAVRQYGFDLSASVLIGDQITDIQAGKAAGVGSNILVNSGKNIMIDSVEKEKIPIYENLYQWSLTLQRS